jgi:hypothetical protein
MKKLHIRFLYNLDLSASKVIVGSNCLSANAGQDEFVIDFYSNLLNIILSSSIVALIYYQVGNDYGVLDIISHAIVG